MLLDLLQQIKSRRPQVVDIQHRIGSQHSRSRVLNGKNRVPRTMLCDPLIILLTRVTNSRDKTKLDGLGAGQATFQNPLGHLQVIILQLCNQRTTTLHPLNPL